MASQRVLMTVLFTDIVGSTERAAALGDHRWHPILEAHNRAVRETLRRHRGREIATAGDGFLALFDSPERAIRCADAIRAAVRDLGIEVRCGLHMGEVERTDGKVEGLAVHIASRILALAGPGEVLVSRTVRDAEAGSGISFTDRGVHDLKGVPGPWRIFAVTGLPDRAAEPAGWASVRFATRPTWVATAAGIAFLLALVPVFILRHRERPPDSGEMSTEPAAPGIAVVPFTVSGVDLALWREGMVDLLATNLDGVGGLRAIDSRTVMARWREQVGEEEPDLVRTLDVARRTGARYAIVGHVVAIGPDVRLIADVYDLEIREKLGQSRTAGSPDSVFALVDRLTIDVVRTILRAGGQEFTPAPDLASITTGSLPALKAFLEGEARYRRSDFAGAITTYEQAVAIDSTFSLAYYRLSNAYGWMENVGSEVAGERLERAARMAEGLPAREALLVRADLALQRGSLDGIEPLRAAIQQYPDDPEAWYMLGDTYVHLGDQALVAESEVGRTLGHAVELDPSFAPYYIHLVEHAVRGGDGAHARRLIETYGGLAPGTTWDRRNRVAADLVFSHTGGRARSYAGLDTMATRVLWGVAGFYLWNPAVLAEQEVILRRVRGRSDAPMTAVSTRIFFNLYNRGRYRAALVQLDDEALPPGFRSFGRYVLWTEGVSLGGSGEGLSVEGSDGFAPDDRSVGPVLDLEGLFAGAYAADRGSWNEHAAGVRDLRAQAERLSVTGDTLGALRAAGAARALEGYGLWKRGRAAEAIPLLEQAGREVTGHDPVLRSANHLLRWWLGMLLEDLGRPAEAARYFESLWEYPLWNAPLAAYRLGGIYAGAKRSAEAQQAYMYALLAWRGADPEIEPRIAYADRALARLASEE
ncbi:MAG TPA: tetratricopeptide repeat protein [Actinomycetota bacterium]|nr:tetratricopeptide repeat protein [Actinomycetota bacterium]